MYIFLSLKYLVNLLICLSGNLLGRESIKMKLVSRERLILRKSFLLIVFPAICNFFTVNASDIDKDPCFFRLITQDKRKIYVIGSIHVSPLEDTLSKPAHNEFVRITMEEKPFLFVEHELDNKDALKILERGEELKDKKNWKDTVIKREHTSLLKDVILIAPNQPSTITIEKLLDIDPWLAAPILSCHANCYFYPHFGGTEYNLEIKPEWKDCWAGILSLEGAGHYSLLEQCADTDRHHNIEWIKKTLYKLVLIKSSLRDPGESKDTLEQQVIQTEKENANVAMRELLAEAKRRHVKKGWEVVNFSDLNAIPSSVFLRNESWPKPITTKLSSLNMEDAPNSFVIICGDGHLAGIAKDKSFLSYLIKAINPKSVDRFIDSSQSWKSVF